MSPRSSLATAQSTRVFSAWPAAPLYASSWASVSLRLRTCRRLLDAGRGFGPGFARLGLFLAAMGPGVYHFVFRILHRNSNRALATS